MNDLITRIGLDKIAHFGVGGLICAVISNVCLLQEAHTTDWTSLIFAAVAALSVFVLSVAKELADTKNGGPFSWADIGVAMLGCAVYALSAVVGIALHLAYVN